MEVVRDQRVIVADALRILDSAHQLIISSNHRVEYINCAECSTHFANQEHARVQRQHPAATARERSRFLRELSPATTELLLVNNNRSSSCVTCQK